jgi:hypothetical protein
MIRFAVYTAEYTRIALFLQTNAVCADTTAL